MRVITSKDCNLSSYFDKINEISLKNKSLKETLIIFIQHKQTKEKDLNCYDQSIFPDNVKLLKR